MVAPSQLHVVVQAHDAHLYSVRHLLSSALAMVQAQNFYVLSHLRSKISIETKTSNLKAINN